MSNKDNGQSDTESKKRIARISETLVTALLVALLTTGGAWFLGLYGTGISSEIQQQQTVQRLTELETIVKSHDASLHTLEMQNSNSQISYNFILQRLDSFQKSLDRIEQNASLSRKQ